MGTAPPEDTEKVRGVFRYADRTVEVITDTAYGDTKKRRALYPLVLLFVAAAALLVAGASALVPVGLAGLLALLLLAVWVGGSGR